MIPQSHALHPFLVQVGHNQVTVVCHTAKEAIDRAKRQLRSEFPRMWDVINSLADNRFEVTQLDAAAN